MKCAACRRKPASIELLCDDCLDQLACPFRLAPDRVRTVSIAPSATALVDPWGRPHPVELATTIGRHLDGAGIVLMEGSVSRHHAHVSKDPTAGWVIRDLGSSNGTFVNDARVIDTVALRPGDRLRFAEVGFYFVELPVLVAGPSAPRPSTRRTRSVPDTLTDDGGPDDQAFEDVVSSTRIGLPSIALELIQPSAGGGGTIEVDGKQAQLTNTQFHLLGLLCQRALVEDGAPAETRGFIGSPELVERLPWDSRRPSDEHLKQLVRRLRAQLEKAGIGDLIESRQGYGYRLRVGLDALTRDPPDRG